MNLNDQSLAKLKCARCQLYLSVGPVSTTSNGFFCGRCPGGAAQMTVYEALAESFAFPCRYQTFGCRERLNWGSVLLHEQTCAKKPHLCPIVPAGVCFWRGSVKDIVKHFEDVHAEDLIDVNVVELKLSEDVEGCKLIHGRQRYIFHVYFSRSQKVLKLNVTQLDDRIKRKYQITLHSHDFSKKITLGANALEPYGTKDHSSIGEDKIIDTDVLKFLTNDNSSVYCEINFDLHKKPSEQLLNLLECPVCQETMAPPIFQCQTGHSFCSACTKKLKDCAFCQKRLTETRNYALEDLARDVLQPCKNRDLGCEFSGPFEERKKHEKRCSVYKCPLSCPWSGGFEKLREHCVGEHTILEPSGVYDLLLAEGAAFKLFAFDEDIFRLCRKYEGEELSLTLQYVGRDEKAAEYFYEVSFVSAENQAKISFKERTRRLTEVADAFDDCLKIPYSLLKLFKSNNKLQTVLKITRNKNSVSV